MNVKTGNGELDPKSLHMKIGHVITRFKGSLEAEYYADFFKNSLVFVRLSLVLAFILYAAFGLLDAWIVPVTKAYTWIIRYAIVCPLIVALFILTYLPVFKRLMQAVLILLEAVLGAGIVIMIALARPEEPGFQFYYAGLMLVIMAGYTLFRMRFVYAAITSWLIVLGYEFVAVYFHGMLANPAHVPIFLNNNFFFISANIIGMLSSFLIEYLLRNDFLLRKKIQMEEEKEKQRAYQELIKTKKELSEAHANLQAMEYESYTGLQSMANTIQNKHAVQRESNIKMAQRMLHLRFALGQLKNKVPKALTKAISVALSTFEKNALASVGGGGSAFPASEYAKSLSQIKRQVLTAFERKHFGSITAYLSENLDDYAREAIISTEDAVNNMNSIIEYIHAIIAYQRGLKVAIEEHVNAALQKIYFNILNSYKKELELYKIGFSYDNRTSSLVVLPVYDFILQEDIIRNLFLNSVRALVESDPETHRDDKRIWIEVVDKRVRGIGDCYEISFRDNGPGIPDDKKMMIFEGYSTKVAVGRMAGRVVEFGVGLRTVKRRVEDIGGTITETGIPGEGAHFLITIPKPMVKPEPRISLDSLSREETPDTDGLPLLDAAEE
jgi:signal transduction histidine kinase